VPFLREAAHALFQQTEPVFEWVLLDNGSDSTDVIQATADIGRDTRVKYRRVEKNLGIIRAMRLCVERASGEYVIPLDSDDVLTPCALAALAQSASDYGCPAFMYSDEDMLVNGRPESPYFRPDWDPVLNLCTSYVFHLCAFRREQALALGVYADEGCDWCHDWDTVSRFSDAGETPVHIPMILYHWRRHAASSTNRPKPEEGSLLSQRHLLQRYVDKQPKPRLFSIERFPIWRGAPELWIRRGREQPEPISLILLASDKKLAVEPVMDLLEHTTYPFTSLHLVGIAALETAEQTEIRETLAELHRSHDMQLNESGCLQMEPTDGIGGLAAAAERVRDGLVVVCTDQVRPDGDEWPWEVICLQSFHRDAVLFSGRILSHERIVLAGGEIFGFNGLVGCPDDGRPENDPGYFALALKQRSVSAVYPMFFAADAAFLRKSLNAIREVATFEFLGAWLGARAATEKKRVIFSPLITAVAKQYLTLDRTPCPEERTMFLELFGSLVPDRRWYSQNLSLGPNGYELSAE
jgi:GT2 family glycosyltransferase